MSAIIEQDILKPLMLAIRSIKDDDYKKVFITYMSIIQKLDSSAEIIKDKIDTIPDAAQKQKLQAFIQTCKSAVLETNSRTLELTSILNKNQVVAKNETTEYFINVLRAIVKDFQSIAQHIEEWNTVLEKAAGSDNILAKGIIWLRSRTDGDLFRINKNNYKLMTIMSKIQRQLTTTEAKQYIKSQLKLM